MDISQIRYYLNYILPDLIQNKIYSLIYQLSTSFWWVFLLVAIIFAVIILILYKKLFSFYRERNKINRFLNEISLIDDIKNFELKILEFKDFFKADYIAFYVLKGESYVLLSHNIHKTGEKGVPAVNLYIVKNLVKIKSKSGNFIVSTYISEKEDFLVQVFSRKFINLKLYSGFIEAIFSIYRKLLKSNEIALKMQLSTITKDIQSEISKSIFSGKGYLNYILNLIKNVAGATGLVLIRDNKIITKLGDIKSKYRKKFFIHNIGCYIEIFTEKELPVEIMKKLGTFLDLTGLFMSFFNKNSNISKPYIDFLIEANEIFEANNPYYKNHSKKVQIMSVEIGKSLLYSIEDLELLEMGALLHDIGMIADISNILSKKEKLSKDEISIIKLHPLVGAILIEPVSMIYPISPIIKYHHEKIDGTGYPYGLHRKEIPEMAQIVGLAEFFVGLISDRPYKKGMDIEKARDIVKEAGVKAFNQNIIEAFLDSFSTINQKFLRLDIEEKRKNEK